MTAATQLADCSASELLRLSPRPGLAGRRGASRARTQPAPAAGLPIGLQIVDPMFGDALVLRAARAFESACPTLNPTA